MKTIELNQTNEASSLSLYDAVAFLQEHFVYWLTPIALFFNTKYLIHPDRRHQIAMSG